MKKNSKDIAKELLEVAQEIINDSAQDQIEDPIGHSERYREGFEKIHKNAIKRLGKSLDMIRHKLRYEESFKLSISKKLVREIYGL